jgi:hypothetical protein
MFLIYKIKINTMKWTEQEINYLKENYKNGDKEEILNSK